MFRPFLPCLGAVLLCVCGSALLSPAAVVSNSAAHGTIPAGTAYQSSGTYDGRPVSTKSPMNLGARVYETAAASVPEPATLGLIATSLLVICGRKRKAFSAS
jgi:hypothetical protein